MIDRNAGNIRRQQVRIALNPAELALYGAGEGFDENRLPRPGHIFEKYVTAGKKCG